MPSSLFEERVAVCTARHIQPSARSPCPLAEPPVAGVSLPARAAASLSPLLAIQIVRDI